MQDMLHAEGFENDGALDFGIKKLEASLKKNKRKDGDDEPVFFPVISIPNAHISHQDEPANFPLVDVPDAEVRKCYSAHMYATEDATA